jgi:CBS domain-containing protein
MSDDTVRVEELQIDGDQIVEKIKELMSEAGVRRLVIKNQEGKTMIDVPLAVGVAGALLKPKLVALGAIAAMVTHGTIVVEKVEAQQTAVA